MSRKRDLAQGLAAARTLTEMLSVDLVTLLQATVPGFSSLPKRSLQREINGGWLAQTRAIGRLIYAQHGLEILPQLLNSPSDQVRGWAAVVLAEEPDLNFSARRARTKIIADDPHFGVRETAWLMLRPALAENLIPHLRLLKPWTKESSENLRRFAVEISRPRGVWCSHLKALRDDPAQGWFIAQGLIDDPSRYVQNSVANWLNDAAKDHPDWVTRLTKDWNDKNASAARRYIARRARRSL